MLQSEHISAIKAEIMAALSKEIPLAVRKAMSPWMDRASAAAYLNVSMETIDLYKRKGRLKPKLIGDKPLYHREALDRIPRAI
jgi:hypothetical protein